MLLDRLSLKTTPALSLYSIEGWKKSLPTTTTTTAAAAVTTTHRDAGGERQKSLDLISQSNEFTVSFFSFFFPFLLFLPSFISLTHSDQAR